MSGSQAVIIRPLGDADRDWVLQLMQEHWGSVRVITRGVVYDVSAMPGFVAWRGDERIGLLTYRIAGDECEIMSLNSLVEGVGAGSALLAAVQEAARATGCRRVWLITTNDNLHALGFYQRRGYHLSALYPNALERSRQLKPQIPLVGFGGIPLRDEIELEILI
ncbi:MAG: GNAT family N-acetyltransferase [Anaerolineae bacterium]|jgi:ribosomal protein S18 acetylase RimI-like enzyme|nr:GNAT family N-acetyltransferase [Anaerolineae bacterium]